MRMIAHGRRITAPSQLALRTLASDESDVVPGDSSPLPDDRSTAFRRNDSPGGRRAQDLEVQAHTQTEEETC